jgi:hypothetical protein
MTADALTRRIAVEGIVTLELAEWEKVREAFTEVERHPTYIAGDLLIARDDEGLLAVEEPTSRTRVLRRLDGDAGMRRFVRERLDTYERMWDGCGCRVDYYR